MKSVNWGIIGAGRIAHSFAADIKSVSQAKLVGVAARSGESAQKFAAQHGIPISFAGYDALFEDPSIDAVYIATPHSCHFDNTRSALQRGKAVLCEKPLTTNADEARQLAAIASTRKRYLMEAMWTYFLPALSVAKKWIQQGKIGTIKHVKSDFGYPQLPYDPEKREYDARLGGGALLEMGIYPIAIAWYFLEQDPQSVQVNCKFAPNGVEDDVTMLFEYPDCLATLGTSFRCKLQNWTYVIGDEGYIAIPDTWRADQCHLYALDDKVDSYTDSRTTLGFNYETEAATQDILEGKLQSDVIPHSLSIRFQEHIEQVKEFLKPRMHTNDRE